MGETQHSCAGRWQRAQKQMLDAFDVTREELTTGPVDIWQVIGTARQMRVRIDESANRQLRTSHEPTWRTDAVD